MLFLMLPPFFFGFLLTVFPRWIGFPDTPAIVFVPVAVAHGTAFVALWLGLLGRTPTAIPAAFALVALGWLRGLAYMASLLLAERRAGKAPTWHGWSALAAMATGLGCLIAALIGIVKLDGLMVHGANLMALWLFVLPVFVTVCHRMIPFFAGNVVAGYVQWRPFRVLAAFWVASVTAAIAYVMQVSGLAATANAALALLTGAMLCKWLPRSAAPGLLWVLIAGFAWAPAGFALIAYADLFAPDLGRAALHTLTVGMAGSLTVAMVTRVTQGHSGRPLAMPTAGWIAFTFMQTAATLRLIAGLRHEDLATLAISALMLAAGLLPWAVRSAGIYLSPRADGKPG